MKNALFMLWGTLGLGTSLAFWLPGTIGFYLIVVPGAWLFPHKQLSLVSGFMKFMSWGILAGLRVGGARFNSAGMVRTDGPALVIMNHQSLVDIPTVNMLSHPYVPAFTTRRRYARFIPLVSPCIRMLRGPLVDPKGDPAGSLIAIENAARNLTHGLLIFPEGHRSVDGDVRPFKTRGLTAILSARQLPVYIVVTDGLWKARRFADFISNIHSIRGETEVLGPFDSPGDPAEVPGFISRMRETLVRRLEDRRSLTPRSGAFRTASPGSTRS
jgi:1-acyl-sn-glycerol-3-phosphate acyltransferase